MSETPRTDELRDKLNALNTTDGQFYAQSVMDFARQLEIENNSLRQQLAGQRNKVLEEAAEVCRQYASAERANLHIEAILTLRTTQPAKERTENEPE